MGSLPLTSISRHYGANASHASLAKVHVVTPLALIVVTVCREVFLFSFFFFFGGGPQFEGRCRHEGAKSTHGLRFSQPASV